VRIRLEVDPATRKRTVTISYESDQDALPHEHEEAHRALVNKLFEGGIVKPGDDIKVEREGEQTKEDEAAAEAPAQREAVKGST
jgi:hypothetical protein